jgi:hypothetical protein
MILVHATVVAVQIAVLPVRRRVGLAFLACVAVTARTLPGRGGRFLRGRPGDP